MNRAIAVDPTYVEAINNLGILYRDEWDIHKSIECYKKCVEMDPFTRNANHNLLLALNCMNLSNALTARFGRLQSKRDGKAPL